MTPHTHHLSSRLCAICRRPLTVHQVVRGEVCNSPQCQRESLLRWLARKKREQQAALRASAVQHRDSIAAALGFADPNALALVLVPASERPATVLPQRRRRLFQQHLSGLLREVSGDRANPVPLPESELPGASQFAEEPPAVGAGCSVCRGHCCRLGGVKAFLDAVTVRRYAEAHPALASRDILRAYISRLPERSMDGSCVFHGESGCALPRSMRASICNTYQCGGLKELQAQTAETVLVVAATETEVVRSGVFVEGRMRKSPGSTAGGRLSESSPPP